MHESVIGAAGAALRGGPTDRPLPSESTHPDREDDGEEHVELLQPAAQRRGGAVGFGELGAHLGLSGVDGEVLQNNRMSEKRQQSSAAPEQGLIE